MVFYFSVVKNSNKIEGQNNKNIFSPINTYTIIHVFKFIEFFFSLVKKYKTIMLLMIFFYIKLYIVYECMYIYLYRIYRS